MWPWELWLNGKRLGKSDADPLFKTQIEFLRPTAGVEINTRSRELADLEGSLLLEPIGFVRYFDDSRLIGDGRSLSDDCRYETGNW